MIDDFQLYQGPLNDWNALKALDSLIPPIPSPMLTEADRLFLPAYGDIPIFLHAGIHLEGDSDVYLDLPKALTYTNSGDSCGTFGPKTEYMWQDWDPYSGAGFQDIDIPISPKTTISTCSTLQHISLPASHEERTDQRTNSTTKRLYPSYMASHSDCLSTLAQACSTVSLGLLSVSHSDSRSLNRSRPGYFPSKSSETLSATARANSNVARCNSPSGLLDPSVSWSTVSLSPGFLSPSTSRASFDSTCEQRGLHREPHRTAIPRSPPILVNSRRPHGDVVRPRTISNETTASCNSVGSNQAMEKNTLPSSPWHGPASLPSSLKWLSRITVELDIDQEGFRSVHPRFSPSGYSSDHNTPSEVDQLASGMVEFQPVQRYIFTFHHAALESAPMLRHLTLTGEDSKDYLSRQASLCVKENSAYVVQGTETNDTNLKYHWRFEYAIDDRRDSAGKAIAGEKTLTPLNFACSPGLLHPTRGTGRKTTIMQQMKKTVWYSKVPAERMHAPTSPVARARLYAHGPLDHKHPSPKALPNTNHPVTPRPSHKRFHSAASPVAFPSLATTAPPVAPLRLRKKRDRAASITDLPPAPPTLAGPSTGRSDSERRRSVTSPAFKVVRHIIPPSKLDELMTASPPQAYAPIFNGKTSPSLVMTPLSPPRRPTHNPPTSPDNDHLSAGASAGTHGQEGVQHRLVRSKRRLS